MVFNINLQKNINQVKLFIVPNCQQINFNFCCFFWLDINQYQFISVISIRNEFISVMNYYNVSMVCIKYTCYIHNKPLWHYLHKSNTLLPILVNLTHILDNHGPIHSKLYSINYEVIQTSQILINNPFIEIQKYHISIS